MDQQHALRRPRKARRWLRTREVERLRVHSLQLDIQALRSEIRALSTTRSLLHERLKCNDHDHKAQEPFLKHKGWCCPPHMAQFGRGRLDALHVAPRKLRISALLNPLP